MEGLQAPEQVGQEQKSLSLRSYKTSGEVVLTKLLALTTLNELGSFLASYSHYRFLSTQTSMRIQQPAARGGPKRLVMICNKSKCLTCATSPSGGQRQNQRLKRAICFSFQRCDVKTATSRVSSFPNL